MEARDSVCAKNRRCRSDCFRSVTFLILFLILIDLPRTLVPKEFVRSAVGSTLTGPGRSRITDTSAVRDYLSRAAQRFGVNPKRVDWIVAHESNYGLKLRGDHGQSRGYWMISTIYHPEVSTFCADDLECSTKWALARIQAGFSDEWSTWRLRCELYENAPECPN